MNNIYYLWNWIGRGHVRLNRETRTPVPIPFSSGLFKTGNMKEIKLTQGQVALVDDDDYNYLNQWKWCAHKSGNTFYAERTIYPEHKTIKMHWIIMNDFQGNRIDHKDSNGLNNQRSNLRFCNKSQNCMNRKYNNKTGYSGVYKVKQCFQASIRVNKKNISLGYYKSLEDAARARDEGSIKYFGEFANLNFK